MAGLTAIGSNVGAGVGQIRFQRQTGGTQMTEQMGPSKDVNAAVLQLIQQALTVSGAEGHDLDVLA